MAFPIPGQTAVGEGDKEGRRYIKELESPFKISIEDSFPSMLHCVQLNPFLPLLIQQTFNKYLPMPYSISGILDIMVDKRSVIC